MLKTLKSSFDALDGFYSADRYRVVEAVVNNSLQKGHLRAKKLSRVHCRIPMMIARYGLQYWLDYMGQGNEVLAGSHGGHFSPKAIRKIVQSEQVGINAMAYAEMGLQPMDEATVLDFASTQESQQELPEVPPSQAMRVSRGYYVQYVQCGTLCQF